MSENKKYKVYTRGGDKGKTALIGGKRVYKNTPKVEAYGTMDELKSHIGLIHSSIEESWEKEFLNIIMKKLFVAESIVASVDANMANKMPQVNESDIMALEAKIDWMQNQLPKLEAFILPSGHPLVAQCHIARTVCRRAERRVIELLDESDYIYPAIQYLNRLSDYLFVYARWICNKLGVEEVKWDGE